MTCTHVLPQVNMSSTSPGQKLVYAILFAKILRFIDEALSPLGTVDAILTVHALGPRATGVDLRYILSDRRPWGTALTSPSLSNPG